MSNPISILVVDDHAMVRSMLKDRLESEPDLKVVAGVGTAEEAIPSALESRPDIVLMDIDMPGMACFEAAKLIMRRCRQTRVVFLSAFVQDRYIERAMEVGAWGYVTKTESDDSLLRAVRNVAAGEAYFSPEIQARIVVGDDGPRLKKGACSLTSTLTPREMEILRYVARGMSKKEIAQTVHISVNTVNRHASSLMNKLNIHDRVKLTRFAIREGLAEG
ncbi:MAG TPA: response regulator transcription factor [Phycisphaerae bacterium]|nr:response regulator transcription factor [Phycisphaerae bacterium]